MNLKTAFLCLALLSAFSACTLIPSANPPQPPGPEGKTYSLGYVFAPGVALEHELTISTEARMYVPTRVLKTLTYPLSVSPDFAQLQVIMTEAFDLNKGAKEDLCGQISGNAKRGSYKIYHDGKVDFGDRSQTSFYFPQRPLKLGETWDFENLTYVLSEELSVPWKDQNIPVVKILFHGQKGGKKITGEALFDFQGQRFVSISREEKDASGTITLDTALVDAFPGFKENDGMLACVKASSVSESLDFLFQKALNFFGNKKYEEAVQVFERMLERIPLDYAKLSFSEKRMLADVLDFQAQAYDAMEDAGGALAARERAIPLFQQSPEYASFYYRARVQLEAILVSQLLPPEKKEAFQTLLSDYLAKTRRETLGSFLFSNKTKAENIEVTQFDGQGTLTDFTAPTGQFAFPLLNAPPGTSIVLTAKAAGYQPRVFVLKTDGNGASLPDRLFLFPFDQNSQEGALAGSCYQVPAPGQAGIPGFQDLSFTVSQDGKAVVQGQCKEGIYAQELAAGKYDLNAGSFRASVEIFAGETAVLHFPSQANQ